MESSVHDAAPNDRVFRAIGHNLLAFQRLEKILKWLAGSRAVVSALHEVEKELARRREKTERSTLGMVIPLWVEAAQGREPQGLTPKTGEEVFISLWHQLNIPEHVLDEHAKELVQLLAERNWLVHEGPAEIDFDSDEACESLLARLEDQQRRVMKQIDFLCPIVNFFREARETFASDDVQEWIRREMFRVESE